MGVRVTLLIRVAATRSEKLYTFSRSLWMAKISFILGAFPIIAHYTLSKKWASLLLSLPRVAIILAWSHTVTASELVVVLYFLRVLKNNETLVCTISKNEAISRLSRHSLEYSWT